LKFLRSKSIVVILALAAVGLVSKNIILPFFHSARPPSRIESNGEIKQQKEEVFQQIESMESESASVADFNNIDWAHDYLRDPFKIQTMVKVVIEEGEPPRYDVLVAVVQEPGKSLAVINDVIVGEGDYYEDFRVIKIGSDSVELEGPDGNKTLEF
jgi:hypothetical protein